VVPNADDLTAELVDSPVPFADAEVSHEAQPAPTRHIRSR
jgi:hypothetical protein